MIYDVEGLPVPIAYSKNESNVPLAYDISGDIVYSVGTQLKVMTYNVQHFNGINSQQTMQEEIITKYNPDIIGIQEFNNAKTVPPVGQAMLSDYPYIEMSNHKNFLGMASKLPLTNIVISDFENQDPRDISSWQETRAYMCADIEVDGKTVSWINTHLCVLTDEYKYLQMEEVLSLAKTKNKVIITGDFNCFSQSIGDTEYTRMFKPFIDAGYHLANCTPKLGITKTASSKTSPTGLSDLDYPCDNIITSDNILISDITVDTTKFKYLNGSAFDHAAVIATVTIM